MSESIDNKHDNDQTAQANSTEKSSDPDLSSKNSIKIEDNSVLPTNNRSSFTSRYGRPIKLVYKPEDNIPKITKPVKSKSPERKSSIKVESVSANSLENGVQENNDSSVGSNDAATQNKIVEPPQTDYKVGHLAWAQVNNYPYWPSIVTPDPDTKEHVKWKSIGRQVNTCMIHVRYFGDRGRHNWVREPSLMPFTGLADFQKLHDEWHKLPDAVKRKDPKLIAGYASKAWQNAKWNLAVKEAGELLPMTIDERLKAIQPADRKRGHPREVPDVLSKKIKLEDEDSKSIISLEGETPPTPPLSHKDSSDESGIFRKYKTPRIRGATQIKRTPSKVPSFDVFYQRRKDAVANSSPDSTEADIRAYLLKSWKNMNDKARQKYRAKRRSKASSDLDTSILEELPTKRKRGKPSKIIEQEDIVTSILDPPKKTRAPNLFRGTKMERVCQICETVGNLIRCKGPCYSYFHLSCVRPGESGAESADEDDTPNLSLDMTIKTEPLDESVEEETKKDDETSFKCIDCLSGVAPACFICNDREEERIKCSAPTCGKHYHASCLSNWPQSHLQGGRLTCPYHMCHTCTSDNPQNGQMRVSHEKVVRCVRCPSAYHASSACLPAGSEIITGSQIICPKHYKPSHRPLNAAWCFLCTRGGSLICCDTCPTSFHAECLGIDAPAGAFICEDCETGRLPLYGEIVWVKLGSYRWWPSRICFPHEVPPNIDTVAHKSGEFCVMFLGTLNYYWVHRGRVFLYQDDDGNVKTPVNKTIVDGEFQKALEDARKLHQQLKDERKEERREEMKGMKPPPYVKLKFNKPVGNVRTVEVDSIVACECDARWENPCGNDTDCLNRILMIECSPEICPAGSRCNNQSFVQRNYPTMEPVHTEGRGWGLRTLEHIKSGQFVIEYVGEVIDEAEYKRRVALKKELRNENYYFLTIDNFRTIDAEPKGNLSRFMNHSCQPNCETQKWTVNGDTRIGLFAVRDIEIGEELTFNYNLASEGETRKPCLCGAPNCSGFIGLKAQKLQLTPVHSSKTDKVKRRSKSKRFSCWRCAKPLKQSENFIKCGLKSCAKRYHRKCVVLQEKYSTCPWHHCVDCNKKTSLHCMLCPIAYCQAHIEGKMTEEKGDNYTRYICNMHEDADEIESQKSSPDEKEESDDNEVDRESLLADSDSPVSESLPGESSPRVSIVEVQYTSEDSDDDGEFSRNNSNNKKIHPEKNLKLQNLTTKQLKRIIGLDVSF